MYDDHLYHEKKKRYLVVKNAGGLSMHLVKTYIEFIGSTFLICCQARNAQY